MAKLIDKFMVKNYKKGDVILNRDENMTELYIVLNGSLTDVKI